MDATIGRALSGKKWEYPWIKIKPNFLWVKKLCQEGGGLLPKVKLSYGILYTITAKKGDFLAAQLSALRKLKFYFLLITNVHTNTNSFTF